MIEIEWIEVGVEEGVRSRKWIGRVVECSQVKGRVCVRETGIVRGWGGVGRGRSV